MTPRVSRGAKDLLIGVLLVAAGAAGLAWQLEGPSASASTRPTLVCPLGAHGLEEPVPLPGFAGPLR